MACGSCGRMQAWVGAAVLTVAEHGHRERGKKPVLRLLPRSPAARRPPPSVKSLTKVDQRRVLVSRTRYPAHSCRSWLAGYALTTCACSLIAWQPLMIGCSALTFACSLRRPQCRAAHLEAPVFVLHYCTSARFCSRYNSLLFV